MTISPGTYCIRMNHLTNINRTDFTSKIKNWLTKRRKALIEKINYKIIFFKNLITLKLGAPG